MPTPHDDRSRLKDILVRKSLSTSGNFELHSGEKSNVYVDGKLTTCFPEAMPLVGHVFLQKLRDEGWSPDAIGGLTVGADPIAFAIARESVETGKPIHAFIVRKEAKKHGKHKLIEGIEETLGLNVVVVDDVCTKGESTALAITNAREAGMHVLGAICLVDRQQGAIALLGKMNVALASIFTLTELLEHQNTLQKSADREHAHTR